MNKLRLYEDYEFISEIPVDDDITLSKAGEKNFKAFNFKERTYDEKVFNNILDIILENNKISEKDFNSYDSYRNKLQFFLNNHNFKNYIKYYESNKYRIKYAAEDYFHKFNELLNKL